MSTSRSTLGKTTVLIEQIIRVNVAVRKTRRLTLHYWYIGNFRQCRKCRCGHMCPFYKKIMRCPVHSSDSKGWQAAGKAAHLFIPQLQNILGCQQRKRPLCKPLACFCSIPRCCRVGIG